MTIFGDDICVSTKPNLPDNAACTKNSQCKSGVCTFEKCRGAAGLPEGSQCSLDSQCATGFCDWSLFEKDICVKKGDNLPDNSACTKNSQCKSGQCTFEKCQGAAGLPEGSKCTFDTQCGPGLTCDQTAFGDDICVKTDPGKTANGEECFWDKDCSSGHCTGVYPHRSCTPSEGNLPNGNSCMQDDQCKSGVCSGGLLGNRKCVAKASNGSTCVYDFECLSGICAGALGNRKCEATKDNRPNGSVCVWDWECASNDCREWGYDGKQCVGGPNSSPTSSACKANGMSVSDAGQCCSKSAAYNNAQLTCGPSTPAGCTCVLGKYAGANCKVVGQSCTGAVTPTIGPNSCNPKCQPGWTCLAGADGKPVCAVEGQDSCKAGDVVTQSSHALGCGAATRICKCVSDKNWSCFCDNDGNGTQGCGDNLKGAKTTRADGSTLWLHLDDEASAKCLCGDRYHQNNNGKYFCGSGDGGNGGGGNGGNGGNPTAVPTDGNGATATPTGSTGGSCKECPKDFKCYSKGGEYKWFVSGYVMEGFTEVAPGSVEEPCAGVPKPNFLGKTKGDANCDGSIDVTDYSLWHKEFFDGDKGEMVKNDWNADFTGSAGKCDGKVDVYDFSLWQKFFSEFKNDN
jgi:hypothetical protein